MTDANVTLTGVRPSAKEAPWNRRATLTVSSLIAGLAIAVLWSAKLVDDDIGVNTAGFLFAFTAGEDAPTVTTRLRLAIRPLAWLSTAFQEETCPVC